jgi:aspartate/methionine/tyrosine aminotransferase
MKELVGQYAPLWESKGGIFSLAQGVVYWEPPESCQEALMDAISGTSTNPLLHTYGPAQGIPELIDALETKLQTENGFSFAEKPQEKSSQTQQQSTQQHHQIMVTVGANQAYVNCVLTCLDESSQAVVFRPYYFNHVMSLQMCCGDSSVVVGPTSVEGIPDVKWLQDTLETNAQIKMVTIVNPGNPTGVSLGRAVLQKVVDVCEQHKVWLVLDCTYEYFTTPDGHQPLATFPESPHVIHIFSFSKSYSLAGYRCGYLVLHTGDSTSNSNLELWTNMLKVQDTLPIGPPRISQIAALGALQAGPEWVHRQYDTLQESRQVILQALGGLEQQIMGGSGAMYVMAQLPPPPPQDDGEKDENVIRDDVQVCCQLVESFGVAVIPGTYCGFPGWIRVCYANLPPDQCRQAAERLKRGLETILELSSSSS